MKIVVLEYSLAYNVAKHSSYFFKVILHYIFICKTLIPNNYTGMKCSYIGTRLLYFLVG